MSYILLTSATLFFYQQQHEGRISTTIEIVRNQSKNSPLIPSKPQTFTSTHFTALCAPGPVSASICFDRFTQTLRLHHLRLPRTQNHQVPLFLVASMCSCQMRMDQILLPRCLLCRNSFSVRTSRLNS